MRERRYIYGNKAKWKQEAAMIKINWFRYTWENTDEQARNPELYTSDVSNNVAFFGSLFQDRDKNRDART